MVESLSFVFAVITKNFHTIFTPVEFHRTQHLSLSELTVHTEPRENVLIPVHTKPFFWIHLLDVWGVGTCLFIDFLFLIV